MVVINVRQPFVVSKRFEIFVMKYNVEKHHLVAMIYTLQQYHLVAGSYDLYIITAQPGDHHLHLQQYHLVVINLRLIHYFSTTWCP